MGKSEKNSPFIKDSTKSKDKIITQNQDNYMIYDSEDLTLIKSISNLPNINAPFGSSSIKSTLLPQAISEAPGPGSYDIEFEINNMNNNIPISDYSNKFFITGDTRFKSSDNHVPGVGEYDLANSNSVNNNKNNLTPKKISRNTKIISHDFKSPRRIPSIPDKDTKFGFGEDREGKMAILTDPYLDQKFDGTQSNSIGPDRYNTLIKKHNNALDWKKAGKKTLEMKIEKNKTEEYYNYDNYKYINNLTSNSAKNDFDKLSDFYNYTNKTEGNITNNKSKNNKKLILNNNNNTLTNRTTRFKIYHNKKIYKNENLGFKDNYDTSYIDLTSVPIKKKTKAITPGPGAYDPNIGNFKFEPKKNKFQNFGTYESRNLLPIPRIKGNKNFLNNSINNETFKNKYINKSLDEKKNLNKFARSLHNLRINLIKEQAMKLKKEIERKIGPGAYSPDLYFNIRNNNIINNMNYNNSEKKENRKTEYISINENPGVGEYDIMGEIKKEIDYFLFLKKSKENKDKDDLKLKMDNARKIIKKKKGKRDKIIIRKEYKDTEEYKIRQQFLKNYYRPAFDSAEPKFKNFGIKDDSNIGVGSYNLLYPQKKIEQIKVPFLNGAKKWSNKNYIKNNKLSINVGPGTYEQRSFFDWNKKSFNDQYKLK